MNYFVRHSSTSRKQIKNNLHVYIIYEACLSVHWAIRSIVRVLAGRAGRAARASLTGRAGTGCTGWASRQIETLRRAAKTFLWVSLKTRRVLLGRFSDKKKKHTDWRTDQRTDQWTDIPSYREAWTHLKIIKPQHKDTVFLAITILPMASESLVSFLLFYFSEKRPRFRGFWIRAETLIGSRSRPFEGEKSALSTNRAK